MQDVLKTRFKEVSGGRMLDVATNNGQFIQRIIESFKDYKEIIGIDINEQMLVKAKKLCQINKYRDVGFLKMNTENLDFVDNCFDFVCISNSLHHLKNIGKSLDEMKRVLKIGGNFIIAEMISDVFSKSQQSHVLFHHWVAKIDTLTGIYHGMTYKKQGIIEFAKKLHFPNLEILEQNNGLNNPFDENVITKITEFIDTTILRVKGHDEYQALYRTGEEIKLHIHKNGWESAPQIIIICS